MNIEELNTVYAIIKVTLDDVEKRIAKLEDNSHPPVFTKDKSEEFDARLQVIEAFYNNIKLITTDDKEIH
tara:strand:+ start:8654 stop:8863 length:210 start_codon:yes stop_codon:yes gene_type:complete